MEVWLIVGQLFVAGVGGLIAAGIWVALGGLGAMSALKNRVEVLEDEHRRVDNRLTRDQKTRSAEKAVEARTDAKGLREVAEDHLASNIAPTALRMPGRTTPKRG